MRLPAIRWISRSLLTTNTVTRFDGLGAGSVRPVTRAIPA